MEHSPSDDLPRYLTEDPYYHIIQVLFGHPHHLASTTELAYYVQVDDDSLAVALEKLADRDILARYVGSNPAGEQPAVFWGFTSASMDVFEETGYLRIVPILRALHDSVEKPDRIQRHEAAERPALPVAVRDRLTYPEPDSRAANSEKHHLSPEEVAIYADRAPDDSTELTGDEEKTRTLDDLFS